MRSASTSAVGTMRGASTSSPATCTVRLSGDTASRTGRTKITRKFILYNNITFLYLL